MTYINGATNEPVPATQLESLIQLSETCVQSFLYDCTLAPLRGGVGEDVVDYAWWTDRHGEQNIYFTGENKGKHVCDCHFEEKGCFEENTKVNFFF